MLQQPAVHPRNRLPIQHELTLALVGRVSRSLPKVERLYRRRWTGMEEARQSRYAMNMTVSSASCEEATIKYVCGIDRWRANPARAAFVGPTKVWWKSAITTALAREEWQIWEEKLTRLDAPPGQILIGMEATSRDARESLSRVGAARLHAPSVASASNASVSRAARITSENRWA